jgi:hypothetical protein
MGGICSTHGRVKNKYTLVGEPEGRRHLGIPTHRWEDNIFKCNPKKAI